MNYGIWLTSAGLLLTALQSVSALRVASSAGGVLIAGGLFALAVPRHAAEAALAGMIVFGLASGWTWLSLQALTSEFRRMATSVSSLIGHQAVVLQVTDALSHEGVVDVGGEVWRARCGRSISRGQLVAIDRIDGAYAIVHPVG